MVREEGISSLSRGVGPNVFRAILMNASQLASYVEVPARISALESDSCCLGTTFSKQN